MGTEYMKNITEHKFEIASGLGLIISVATAIASLFPQAKLPVAVLPTAILLSFVSMVALIVIGTYKVYNADYTEGNKDIKNQGPIAADSSAPLGSTLEYTSSNIEIDALYGAGESEAPDNNNIAAHGNSILNGISLKYIYNNDCGPRQAPRF